MSKLKNRIGMTMAEMLIVVAIIAVLGGVAFIAVNNHQRTLGQLERDGIAKEIFVAAQNHLTIAYGEGYLGATSFGTSENPDDPKNAIYYFVVNGSIDENSVLGQMLPFGSIDETIRAGGSYIIRYQKDAGMILDVFYCTRSGTPEQYNHELASGEYETVLDLRDTESVNNKSGRRNWNGHILGWYGGAEVAEIATITLKAPDIKVENGDKLKVIITDDSSNSSYSDKYSLKLIITGNLSKAQKAYTLLTSLGSSENVEASRLEVGTKYNIILDDITEMNKHFFEINADTDEKFIPGENLTVQAVAYSIKEYSNIAYSAKKTTNSLFDDGSTANTAHISSFRHLENLDKTVSNLDARDLDARDNDGKLNIGSAVQLRSLDWSSFNGGQPSTIYDYNNTALTSANGYYFPIQPNYALAYNGMGYSISNVLIDYEKTIGRSNMGLFGAISTASAISNLELVDFSVKGESSAGALAGSLTNSDCKVINVLARNSTNAASTNITATSGPAGGLIGNMSGIVQYSAAAVIVGDSTTKPTNAGGLIGSASGTITGCYSGGHTQTGSYEEWVKTYPYDVTGVTAGGLVGTSSAMISESYSTCSVSGATAGGFAGSASGSITNSYATGYIDPNATTKYAFVAGSLPSSSTGNWYFRTINKVPSTKPNARPDETEPMFPYKDAGVVSNHISYTKPIDLNADTYNTFVGVWDKWNPARAFDSALVKYYSGSYTLKTIDELTGSDAPEIGSGYTNWNELFIMTHYGDWPSPEVFFINNK